MRIMRIPSFLPAAGSLPPVFYSQNQGVRIKRITSPPRVGYSASIWRSPSMGAALCLGPGCRLPRVHPPSPSCW